MKSPFLAAISTDAATGGVAQVSRMLALSLTLGWGDSVRVVRLCEDGRIRPTRTGKMRFSTRIAIAQASGRCAWTLFGHLHLLRVLSMVPARLRAPYAVFLHGIEAWGPLYLRDRRLLEDAALRLANSNFTARLVMQRHPDVGPVIACPLALPPVQDSDRQGLTSAASRDLPWRIGDAAVLIVGRMLSAERYKGHEQLIDAFPLVVQHVPQAQLIIAGTGDDVERLRERARESGAGDSIIFTGFVSNPILHALYERCAVFAMPSLNEGFGLVYLEAMAHGLPCIGSRDDAAAEVIAGGETGVLVTQSDGVNLAAEIVCLLRDRGLRERMGAAGKRRVEACFSFERFADQVIACLRGALE